MCILFCIWLFYISNAYCFLACLHYVHLTSFTCRLWDLKAGLLLQTMIGHSERVVAVALAANGEKALSASSDGTVKVWSTDVHSR